MAYEWTPEMARANPNAALEPFYRIAVSTAAAHLESVDAPGVEVLFTGGQHASPRNPPAVAMATAIFHAISALPVSEAATVRMTILTFAVRAAFKVRSNGYGDAGWAAFAETLNHGRPRRPLPG